MMQFPDAISDTSGYETMLSEEPSQLVVKLPSVKMARKRSGPRKRVLKALKKSSRELKSLKQENNKLSKACNLHVFHY